MKKIYLIGLTAFISLSVNAQNKLDLFTTTIDTSKFILKGTNYITLSTDTNYRVFRIVKQKVAFLIVTNFEKNQLQWVTGYRTFKDYGKYSFQSDFTFTYKNGRNVKDTIIDYRIL